ncbi:FecR domain-containing protein [Fodinibius sp.]|uniref:FecR domain-containing protein n=1 Tax=Fodinibius sp. TaxID=1872440 RepID=UPI002ACE3EBD|nr:FecR domain-containing protein [Fodinibius sp.]MDZ7658614.1 FecR domain-containing protein [Fodinibius sp.]
MELNGKEYQLIASYLAGECTDQERRKVEQWIDQSHENKKRFQELRRIWQLSGEAVSSQDMEWNLDQEWNRLGKQINNQKAPSSSKNSEEKRYWSFRSSSIHSGTQKFIRIAAVFLVAGLFGMLSYQSWEQPQQKEPVLRQISTDNGQRANLTLADGTEVMLNADSELKLPQKFASDVREVHLDGEAYFKVSENEQKPFVVHSNGSIVRVLGTAFSVRAYPEEQQVQVVVEEGRVSFGQEKEAEDQRAILNRNELGTFDISTSTVATQKVEDIELYMSWREGYLKFEETKMSDVAKALERRYDVKIFFENSALKELELTSYLKSRSLRNVLDVITTSLEIEYQLDENKVTFMK